MRQRQWGRRGDRQGGRSLNLQRKKYGIQRLRLTATIICYNLDLSPTLQDIIIQQPTHPLILTAQGEY